MRIGIITFHRAHNYGALLQCFALKRYIESLGHTVNIIDYWPDYHRCTYQLLPDFSSLSLKSKIKSIVFFLMGINRILQRANGYKKFMVNHLGLSNNIEFKSGELLNQLEYDVIVYGSDQIWWNATLPEFKGFDWVYWGQQPSKAKRKISYAPSMGVVNFQDSEREMIKQMLRNFDSISVRENAVKNLFEGEFGTKASLVLDPVFLLDGRQWEALCERISLPFDVNEKFVLLYQLVSNEEACNLAERVSKYFNWRIIEIRGRVDALKFGNRYLQTICPLGFVKLVKHASFIVTTSFHGTAFSIVFEKQFLAAGMGKNSERAKSLLTNIGLEHRYISDVNEQVFSNAIDYKHINVKIDHLKNESKSFLQNNL